LDVSAPKPWPSITVPSFKTINAVGKIFVIVSSVFRYKLLENYCINKNHILCQGKNKNV
jgi:hypothetical protein